MKNFFKDDKGSISLAFVIIFPVVIALLAFSFNTINLVDKKAKLSNLVREAALSGAVIEDKEQKKKHFKNVLKSYFSKSQINKMNIEEHNESTDYYATTIETTSLFGDPAKKYKIKETANIEKTNALIDTDFAFALDFSSSMLFPFDISDLKKGMCNAANKDYDEVFCKKIESTGGRAINALQEIIKKIIRDSSKNKNFKATYSLVPFAEAVQTKTATMTGDELLNYVLQITLKSSYSLENYDYWSGIRPRNCNNNNKAFSFSEDRFKDHPQLKKAINLYNAISSKSPCLGSFFSHISRVIDYEKTMQNMFDLDKAISFRMYSPIDTNPSSPIEFQRPNGIIWIHNEQERVSSKDSIMNKTLLAHEVSSLVVGEDNDAKASMVLNQHSWGEKTFVMNGFLRAVANLSKGKHPRRALFLVTDGVDSNEGPEQILVEDRLIESGVCERIKEGLKERGAEKIDIYVLNINEASETQNFVRRWSQCTEEKNIISADGLEEFFQEFKKFYFGGSGMGVFINKKQ